MRYKFLLLFLFLAFLLPMGSSVDFYSSNLNAQTYITSNTNVTVNTYNQTWLSFDGVNDEITFSASIGNFNATGLEITFSSWAYFNNIDIVGQDILSKRFGGSDGYILKNDGDDLLFVVYNSTNTAQNLRCSNVLLNRTFQHIALSINSTGNVAFYINGTRYCNVQITNNYDAGLLRIFKIAGRGTEYLNGSIDDVKVFNYSLNDNEIYRDYINERKFYRVSNRTKTNDTTFNTAYIYNNSLYTTSGQDLYKSTNRGVSFLKLCDNCVGNLIYIDNRTGNIFSGLYNGNLSVFIGNETNWTEVDVFNCADNHNLYNSSFQDQGMTTDDLGNIYLGEYGGKDANSNCSFIYKSQDGGLNWVNIYNSSSYNWDARHIHFVQFNPYNKCLYATQGDPRTGSTPSRLFRSCDYGLNWVSLGTGDVRWQYLAVQFEEGYSFFGTDLTGLTNYIDLTTNDVDFVPSLSLSPDYGNYLTSSGKTSNGYIIFGLNSNINKSATIWATNNHGNKWFAIDTIHNISSSNIGFPSMSFISDDLGFNYIIDDASQSGGKMNKFNIIDIKNLQLYIKIDENNSTIVHDASGNSNNGTISGATWNNDGISVSNILNPTISVESNWLRSPAYLFYNYLISRDQPTEDNIQLNNTDTTNAYTINIYNITNALVYHSNGTVLGSTTISANDNQINVTIPARNTTYVLDDYTVTETARQFSPLSISGTSTSKTITSSLTQSINATVIPDLEDCNTVNKITYNDLEWEGSNARTVCNSLTSGSYTLEIDSGTNLLEVEYGTSSLASNVLRMMIVFLALIAVLFAIFGFYNAKQGFLENVSLDKFIKYSIATIIVTIATILVITFIIEVG